MPRLIVVKTVFFIALSSIVAWLLLAIPWAFLPSIPYGWEKNPSKYLQSGGVITRVYELSDFYYYYDQKETVRDSLTNTRGDFFIIDYALESNAEKHSSSLRLDNSLILNLTYYSSRVSSDNSANAQYISPTLNITVRQSAQDGCGLLNINQADATLLCYNIKEFEQYEDGVIAIRVRALTDKIEIWPDSSSWDGIEGDEESGHSVSFGSPPASVPEPFLSLSDPSGQNFKDSKQISVSFPTMKENSSPSRTYLLRLLIGKILVPSTIFIHSQISLVAEIIGLIFSVIFGTIQFLGSLAMMYVFIVGLCWLMSGRPAFWSWARTCPLTRPVCNWVRRKAAEEEGEVWGPSGPVSHSMQDEDEIGGRRRSRPRPLRNMMGFFQSSSPLDDLLVTFESTRHWVEPLSLARRRRALLGDDESGGNLVDTSHGDIVIRVEVPSKTSSSEGDRNSGKNLLDVDTGIEKG